MANRMRTRRNSAGNRSDWQTSPAVGIVPLRPPPAPPTVVRNLAASLIGSLQEDVRCSCQIEKSLYTGDTQGGVLKWNCVDATREIFLDGLGAPLNVLVSMNGGKEMWAGLANGNISLISLATRRLKNQVIHSHDAAVNCIAPGITCAWSGGDDFLIKKWDLEGAPLFAYNHHHGSIRDLLVLRDDQHQMEIKLWSSSNDATISIVTLQDNIAQHELASGIKLLSGHTKAVLVLCQVGADAIWSGCEDGSIGVWSMLGLLKKHLQAHKGPVGSFIVMGAHVWSGSGDHTILVWEASLCELLFTLGDHGGYVKALVRVDYMCWVFASGKNVKIWCAQSVWDTYEEEKGLLNRTMVQLKGSLAKVQREKELLEDAIKKAQEANAQKFESLENNLQEVKHELTRNQANATSESQEKNIEITNLNYEHARKLQELEASWKVVEETNKSLQEEIMHLLEKQKKLQLEKNAVEATTKENIQGLQRDLKRKQEDCDKTLVQVADLKSKFQSLENNLAKTRSDFQNVENERSNLLSKNNIDSQRIAELERILNMRNGKEQVLEGEIAKLKDTIKNEKNIVDMAFKDLLATHANELGDLETKLKKMEEEMKKSEESLNGNIKIKDAEIQKLQNDVKKKVKESKKAAKLAEDEKALYLKETGELKQLVEQMKKNKEDTSESESASLETLARLTKELQNANDELQKALSDQKLVLTKSDLETQKSKEAYLKHIQDLVNAQENIEAENKRLQNLIEGKEMDEVASRNANDQIWKKALDLESTNQTLQYELEKANKTVASISSEKIEIGKDLVSLSEKLKEVEEQLMQLRTLTDEDTTAAKNLVKEKQDLLKSLDKATLDRENLENELAHLKEDLAQSKQEQTIHAEDLAKLVAALDQGKKEKAMLVASLAEGVSELQQLKLDNSSHKIHAIERKNEREKLKKENKALEYNIQCLAGELEQVKRHKPTGQDILAQQSHEMDHFQEDKLIMGDGIAGFEQRVMKMQREIERLQLQTKVNQDDCRIPKEGASIAAADADLRVEELQKQVAQLESTLNEGHALTYLGNPLWERIRELEMALMQAHMDYRILSQEIRLMRKKRKSYQGDLRALGVDVAYTQQNFKDVESSLQRAIQKFNYSTKVDMTPSGPGGALDLALKAMQPGCSIEYTNFKVSASRNKANVVKNVEVYAQTSGSQTPHALIPQKLISIREASPPLENIQPTEISRFVSNPKERYFPSVGAMRVRRGLGPPSRSSSP